MFSIHKIIAPVTGMIHVEKKVKPYLVDLSLKNNKKKGGCGH